MKRGLKHFQAGVVLKKQAFMFICLMLMGTTLLLPIGCGPTATNTNSNAGCDPNCAGSDGKCYSCGEGGVCSKADLGNCSAAVAGVRCCYGGGGDSKYDGTYDWSVTVHGGTSSCQNCVTIKDGAISNSEGSFSGTVSEHPVFYGPCPNGNSSIATYSGTLVGSNPYKWKGIWTCNDGSVGGADSPWQIY